jgi:Ca2+-binding EF-hand superfamily protein
VKEVDEDGNGEIDFNEFKTMMQKLLNDEGKGSGMSKFVENKKKR